MQVGGKLFEKAFRPLVLSLCGSVTLAFCRRTVAAFIALAPPRYADLYGI